MLKCAKIRHPLIYMQIGSLTLDSRVILAPMAGISDLPFRLTMKPFGVGLVYTEMISAKGLLHAGKRTRELLRSAPDERPLGIQLFGSDPEDLAAAAATVVDDGELIDLNLGCPVPKVVRNGAGSALLRDPQRVARVVAAVRKAVDLPLTVKIRSGWDQESINFIEIGKIAEDEGADALILHPRTRAQGFSGRSDWTQIGALASTLTIPVIGSGDIASGADAKRMTDETGCAGVMIGRGSYGNPWLLRDADRALSGLPPLPPASLPEKLKVALAHQQHVILYCGETRGVLEMRKHLCWYVRGLPGAASFRAAVNRIDSLAGQKALLEQFFFAIDAHDKEPEHA